MPKVQSQAIYRLSKTLKENLPILTRQYKINNLKFFGSYVRSEQKKGSDLDILVDFKTPPTLLEFIELENRISDLLGIKVDLVMKKALKPVIGKYIIREAISI